MASNWVGIVWCAILLSLVDASKESFSTLTRRVKVGPGTSRTPRGFSEQRRVAVIGAGVIGLSTATAILDLVTEKYGSDDSVHIDVFYDRSWENTLSRGIAGLFRIDKGTHINRVYGNLTFNHMAKLFREVGGISGVQLVSGHIISNDLNKLKLQEKNYGDIVYNFRYLNQREIDLQFNLLNGTRGENAIHYTAYTSEGLKYCPYMREKLVARGVQFIKRHVWDLDELASEGKYDVIINSAGLDGGELAKDEPAGTTYPIRGVLLKVDAPWQKHFLYRDFGTFTIPVIDSVYVGTVKEDNSTDLTSTNEEEEMIFNKYLAIQPAMKRARVVNRFVGLRPGRANVRVERQMRNAGNVEYTMVHNYGHGGNGFTLGWGTSVHAAHLALGLDTNEFDRALKHDAVDTL